MRHNIYIFRDQLQSWLILHKVHKTDMAFPIMKDIQEES